MYHWNLHLFLGLKQQVNLLGSGRKGKKPKGLNVKEVVEKNVKRSSGSNRKSASVLVPRPTIKILERDPFMETRFVLHNLA